MKDYGLVPYDDPIEAIYYAIKILEDTLEKSGNALDTKYVEQYELRRYLPFSLEFTSVDDRYILTNRRYKPLGITEGAWVDYDRYTTLHVHLTEDELSTLVRHKGINILWDNHPYSPMNSVSEAYEYLKKLKRLLNILESKK